MPTAELDPLIHVPTRLKIVATLAALPDGDTLSFTRLQDLIGLTPGNLIIHLRKLEDAGYISNATARDGRHSAPTPRRCATCSAAWTETDRPTMSTSALDPLIHDPERLRVVATL